MINMTNTDGLTAIDYDAEATSTNLIQDVGQGNFRELQDISTKWELVNISQNSTPDKFISKYPLYDGDKFYLVKADNSIHELLNPIVNSRDLANSIMTSNTLPSGVASNNLSAADAYLAFDGDVGTYTLLDGVNSHLTYKLDSSTKVLSYYLKCEPGYGIVTFRLEGSTDGASYATISLENSDQQAATEAGQQYEIQSPGDFLYYRVVVTSDNANTLVLVSTFNLLLDSGDYVDTTSITAGEIPTKVFRFSDTIEFNSVPITSISATPEYDDINDIIKLNVLYNTAQFNAATIATTIKINTIGNSFKEIIGRMYRNS